MNLENITKLFTTEEIIDSLVSNPEFLKRIHEQNSDEIVDYLTMNSIKYNQLLLDARKDVHLAFYNEDKEQLEEILSSEYTMPDALSFIYEAGDMRTKVKVKHHPNCPKYIKDDGIDWISKIEKEDFRQESIAKLKSSDCTEDDIRQITSYFNEELPALDALKNVKCPEDVLRKYSKSKNQLYLRTIIEHSGTPWDVLQDLCQHEKENIRNAAKLALERFKEDE